MALSVRLAFRASVEYDWLLMSTNSAPTTAPKTDAKRARILDAATDLIIENGYDGTNLEQICERAACSKTSIYDLFGNKEGLLAALTEDIAVDLSRALHTFHMQHLSVEDTLRRYARMALSMILDERHIAIVRATISAVWKHPGLGPAYYEVGALTAQAALAQYFRTQTGLGVLAIAEPERAAREFQGMLLWDRMLAQVVGAKSTPTREEIEREADLAVDDFLARHRATAGHTNRDDAGFEEAKP